MLLELSEKTSKKELAELAGVSGATMTDWTTLDWVDVREKNARRLCEILNLDYEAEMRRQHQCLNSDVPTNVNIGGGNNKGCVAIQSIGGGHSLKELISAITSPDLDIPEADRLTALRVLAQCGIL